MKKILVTGGAGFIGSGLVLKLLKNGDAVTSIDNYFTGQTRNLDPCKKFDRFNEITHDVVDYYNSSSSFDQIYHLACPASPIHYQSNPIETTLTCVNGTYNFLELARKNQAKILFSSTSEIYGDPKQHPQKESYRGNVNPIGIRSCYDEGKRMSESLCFDFYRMHKLSIKIVRIFNTYGENMNPNDGRVVSNFINQAIKGENLTVYGKGTQTRSFCYVSDLINGIISMMNDNSKWMGPVNLGNPYEITINELAEEIITLTGTKSKLINQSLPQDDPEKRRPDINLAKNKLGWEPVVPLKLGIEKTIKYFKNAKSW